jgi:hypothetical protein
MKLINASWEERNSGLKTCEIVFEKGDSIDDYLSAKVEESYRYSVVKVPSDNINLVHNLEEVGYKYIESQFNISVATSELGKMDEKWMKVIKNTNYKKVENRNDLEIILLNIAAGLFEKDRISLDENLGKEISSLRYTNWIKDLYKNKNAEIFYLLENNRKAGFFVIQKDSVNTNYSVIAGIFEPYQGRGLSVALIYYYLKLASVIGAKQTITSFSSNNLSMLNTFTRTVSFKVLNVFYVLKKIVEN